MTKRRKPFQSERLDVIPGIKGSRRLDRYNTDQVADLLKIQDRGVLPKDFSIKKLKELTDQHKHLFDKLGGSK